MSHSVLHDKDPCILKYIITHVFFPLQLPDGDDHSISNDQALTGAVASAAHFYREHFANAKGPQWHGVIGMLENLRTTVKCKSLDRFRMISQIRDMNPGDIRVFFIRAQNSAIVFRKQDNFTIFESFELSAKAEDVMASQGRLICSYPGPAIEIPTATFDDEAFLSELANFLVHMNSDVLPDAAPSNEKAQSTVLETRDTTHPRYITELLTGILRSVGRPTDIIRISKRVGDDVVWNNSELPWRRSSLWLLIRVTLQITLERSTLGRQTYKAFMLFFMCCIAREPLCADLPNDLLQAMSCKISRRLRKLRTFAPELLSGDVLQVCTLLRSTLEKRWKGVQRSQCMSPPWNPSQLNLARDTHLSLLNCHPYLRNTLANRSINSPYTQFNPKHHRRGVLADFLSSNSAFFEEAYHVDPRVTLYDVERAVEFGIDAWVGRVKNNDEACIKLVTLANKYSTSALKTYGSNPELLSVMLLTTVELWVALDKIAIKKTPMLAEYSPEVPTSLLEDLLFCRRENLVRLHSVYQYLSHRHSSSKSGWSVFSPIVTADSFAVRFYRGSSHLQHLKTRIEDVARNQARQKVVELEKANAGHAKLQQQTAEIDHEYGISRYGNEYHAYQCKKCQYEAELRSMEISVHEWPLPAEQLHAEVAVFELDCPASFDMWRTATFHLLVDLCTPSVEPKPPYIQLHDYAALRPYFVERPESRVTLGSERKPFVLTHYSKTSIPTSRERVCLNNGLLYYGFDSHARIPVSEVLDHLDIRQHCTYQLHGSYQSLQKYVDSTLHTSNEVIADQSDCHKDLSIHEFIAFGNLRSGSLLQWLNILRELRGRSLSFYRHEVHFLLAQAVSQVGPLKDKEWTWHKELYEPSFCHALLEELESLVHDVEANWLEAVTMDTISFLLRRLLASGPEEAISRNACEILRSVRSKVFSWTEELSEKLVKAPGDEELRGFLRDTAIICRGTFDVDPSIIPELLHSAEDIKVFTSSAILIRHNTPANVSSLSAYSQLLLDRNLYLSLALESVARDIIHADSSDEGIDLAVSWVWPDYRPGSKWTSLRSPNSRWLSCKTESTANQSSQTVHFNLLDGSLLVDGKPLGRLPSEIQQHSLYILIFGEQVLEVVPGDLPGMDYATRGRVSDYQVYFSLRDKNLVIRAIAKCNSEVVELIPPEKLEGDLPAILIEGHAHWLNLSSSVMEIRPLDNLWESSSENWRMDCTPGRCRLHRGQEFLVDIRSKSWEMVSNLLQPLDSPRNLVITVSPTDPNQPSSSSQLSVALPRYGLSFYVDEDGDLQSHNIRGMVYDKTQYIGTLFGLANQLVLRPKFIKGTNSDELVPRCVLIPEGKILFWKDGHHVHIEINTSGSALRRIAYQIYRIDTDLGCLVGNASLTNKFFCAYLHALSSGCNTDPLTGRTGTEEALSLLRSAGCWSIMKFSSREAELLCLIASICPPRTWYPLHLQRMQTVDWLDLPVSSQHHGLYIVCKEIKDHYERIRLFHEGQSSTSFEDFPCRDDQLLKRSAGRAAYLYPPEFSEKPPTTLDVPYVARDVVKDNSGEHRAYTAATVVYRRIPNSTTNKDIVLDLLKSWKDTVSGNAALSLRYDKSWLSPKLSSIWLKAYNLLRGSGEGKWPQLLFSLPAMVYASPKLSDLVPSLVAFAVDSQFRLEDSPNHGTYELSRGYRPCSDTLREYISDCSRPFEGSPESAAPAKLKESPQHLQKRRAQMYKDRRNLDTDTTIEQFLKAWPCETPPRCSLNRNLYNIEELTSNVERLFAICYRNLNLKEHFTRVQKILNTSYSHASPVPTSRYSFNPSLSALTSTSWSYAVDKLFSRPVPSLPTGHALPRFTSGIDNASLSGPVSLHRLIATVEESAINEFQRKYVSALRTSAECLNGEIPLENQGVTKLPTTKALKGHYALCRASYIEGLEYLIKSLGPKRESEQALEQSGQWPRITALALFRFLASNSPVILPNDWKKSLIKLALLAVELQRARRLLRLHLDDLREELCSELENEGCEGWNPEMHPDWLLIQVQSNLQIRRVQAGVAKDMIAPQSGNNTAMQLNMGEGKSSVIVPIVAADLADGDQLVRVIVPKALTAQMFYILADRLGGIINRRIYYVPFSRSIQLDHQKVVALREIMSECMKERGILVVQPEHILSLRLVSVEKQLPEEKDTQLADMLLSLQRWLHSHSRDILDESDEILHVRYQLVYTIGHQKHMEGFPERWTITQQILGLVNKHAPSLRELFPLGVEYEHGPSGSFPHLRILHTDAGQQLISWIIQDVIDGVLSNFSFGQLRQRLRDAIKTFISCEEVPPKKARLVRNYSQQTPLWAGLLLLRGLLTKGILLYAFRERRWRVDYGLAPWRTMLAVPYRAKDVPAQRAEFGHPDVAILLTCLSYYYCGLNEEQLRLSFEILLKQDDPTLDFGLWVRDCSDVPACLQNLSGINTKSSEQWNKFLFPLFSRNRETVNFYLSSVVFPREAKEFPSKLSCSGWDLAEKKKHLLTGFSGTNDGQYLLPQDIIQRDPDHQRGTNAKVLSYLLRQENKHYMCVTHENGERPTTYEFLQIVVSQKPEIRVLLDIGAQMLDLRNYQVAEAWLHINTHALAAIYFNEEDELTVCTRDGSIQLLLSSPFAQQLDQCVVYLDDAHTRGTDIKLPSGFRAAVTLGPKVTKDRLTQGCMRMRKLGHGHSIMFFAPLEVDRRIRTVAGKDKDPSYAIDTIDILHWAIRETCDELQRRAPHWAQQGMDHEDRFSAWTRFCRDQLSPEALSDKWLQPEAKRLEDLYGPRNTSNSALLSVPGIHQRCVELGVLSLRDVSMNEEQEREVIHEVERERHVERPPKAPPASHSIHPHVIAFVKTGIIPANTNAFRPAFQTLSATSAVTNEAHIWSPFVFVTTDFRKTVSSPGNKDNYLRPVQWVVSAKSDQNEALVILSPYEVNHLMPDIRLSKNVHLHLYTARVTRSMKSCDDLALYTIPAVPARWKSPSSLVDQLNIFAGQLYLTDYETYIRLCRFLCVYTRDLQNEKEINVGCDGFISPNARPTCLWPPTVDTFQNSPMSFVRTLISLRRKGMRFAPTHMGKLLNGGVLSEDDFDYAKDHD